MNTKTILITGANGLVGRSLVRYLVSSGKYQVFIMLRRPEEATDWFARNKKINMLTGDITDKQSLQKSKQNFDIIFHLAANLSMFEKNNLLKNTNIQGLKNVLSVYNTAVSSTFIFASSIDAGRRNNDYAKTKVLGEKIVKEFHTKHPHTNFINVRIGNVYTKADGGYPTALRNFLAMGGWRSSILYHELSSKNVFPIELENLSMKLTSLIDNKKVFGKTVEIYDSKLTVGNIFEQILKRDRTLHPPLKMLFGGFLLNFWSLIGKLTRRGDVLIYLKSEQ